MSAKKHKIDEGAKQAVKKEKIEVKSQKKKKEESSSSDDSSSEEEQKVITIYLTSLIFHTFLNYFQFYFGSHVVETIFLFEARKFLNA